MVVSSTNTGPAAFIVGRSRARKGDHHAALRNHRCHGWASPEDLQAAAARSTEEGEKEGSGVRWIPSYVSAAQLSTVNGTLSASKLWTPAAVKARVATQPNCTRPPRTSAIKPDSNPG